ncbi:Helix-turn-helix [Romboutsia ilealis]|uniref:Helix-turn-helix n=1 Tax=Romboutsia ilealis TaxID=1115758 RepID=A0A1V1HYK0_9FIRM|nr:helix-turn-helix transcriptional regulator [Romboutsia ilealis]CED92957.1 Helix-turn-helix [Romboutsia ilealis]
MFSLKLARIKKNLTQKQLAELVGVSSSTINRIETGKQVLKLDMLSKLAEVLEIQVNELLEVK